MNFLLFSAITILTFALCILFSVLGKVKGIMAADILSSLIIAILAGVISNVISYAITFRWEPGATVPEASISTTEPTIFVGDIIQFGSYPQESSKNEPIDWLVLDVEDDKMLVISCDALDCQKYHSQNTNVTWETCSLRQWLNNTFYNTAFTAEERAKIHTTTVSADPNALYYTDPGADTQDKLFLLSITEANEYFRSNNERICRATMYAVNKDAYVNKDTGGTWWWLRTPGSSNKDAASVNSDGTVDYDDGSVTSYIGAVRPAIWISLD